LKSTKSIEGYIKSSSRPSREGVEAATELENDPNYEELVINGGYLQGHHHIADEWLMIYWRALMLKVFAWRNKD